MTIKKTVAQEYRERRRHEISLAKINRALHELIEELIKRGESALLLTHPNSTIRLTAQSYLRKDEEDDGQV